jgi:peptide deformylase
MTSQQQQTAMEPEQAGPDPAARDAVEPEQAGPAPAAPDAVEPEQAGPAPAAPDAVEPEQAAPADAAPPEQAAPEAAKRPAAEPPEGVVAGEEPERTPEAELDPETIARRDAALARVRKFGDPALRAEALPVERFDEALAQEAERMGQLMHDALGVGLAATQLGVLHRVLVYQAYSDDPLRVLVNPEILWRSDELESAEEGCLSLPGVHVQVERAAAVKVRASDERGDEVEVEAEGLEARVIQHEIDHLDGILVLDRIPREARKEAMRAMREAMSAPRVS